MIRKRFTEEQIIHKHRDMMANLKVRLDALS